MRVTQRLVQVMKQIGTRGDQTVDQAVFDQVD